MLNKDEAQKLLTDTFPDFPVQSSARYGDLYLFRVKYPYPGEENYDPFISVDLLTGEVRDFSVLTDGDISEIARLDWKEE